MWLAVGPYWFYALCKSRGKQRSESLKMFANLGIEHIVGIDANQLYPFSITKETPTGSYKKGITMKRVN